DPGYKTETLLVVPLDLDEKRYDETRGRTVQQQLYARLTSMPGVEAVSYATVMPLGGSRYMASLFVAGEQPLPAAQMAFDASVVGPHYHETMGIEMVHGRGFTEQDRKGVPGVVVINQALARQLFGTENAVGRRVTRKTGVQDTLEVIGVTRDIKYHDLTETPVPHFDLPALQGDYDSYTNFVMRTKGSVDLIPGVRNELLNLDQSLPVREVAPLATQLNNTL